MGRQVVALEVVFWRVLSGGTWLAGAPCQYLRDGPWRAVRSIPHHEILSRRAQAVPSTMVSVFPVVVVVISGCYLGVRFSQLACHFTDKKRAGKDFVLRSLQFTAKTI